jgi:hypothetical protein
MIHKGYVEIGAIGIAYRGWSGWQPLNDGPQTAAAIRSRCNAFAPSN